jgi:hypothetical protein
MATRMRKDPGPIPKAPSKKIPAGKKPTITVTMSTPKGDPYKMSPKGSQATMKRGTVVKPAIPKDKWGSAE